MLTIERKLKAKLQSIFAEWKPLASGLMIYVLPSAECLQKGQPFHLELHSGVGTQVHADLKAYSHTPLEWMSAKSDYKSLFQKILKAQKKKRKFSGSDDITDSRAEAGPPPTETQQIGNSASGELLQPRRPETQEESEEEEGDEEENQEAR